MLHLRWRDCHLPNLTMESAPDFGQFPILEDAQSDDQDHQADESGAKTLHEYAPDFGEREHGGEYLKREIRGVTHDDRGGEAVEER